MLQGPFERESFAEMMGQKPDQIGRNTMQIYYLFKFGKNTGKVSILIVLMSSGVHNKTQNLNFIVKKSFSQEL